jgi:hypothetical protein
MSVGVAMVWPRYKITAPLNFYLQFQADLASAMPTSGDLYWVCHYRVSIGKTLTDIVDAFLCVAEMAQPTLLPGWIFKHIGTCRLSLLS